MTIYHNISAAACTCARRLYQLFVDRAMVHLISDQGAIIHRGLLVQQPLRPTWDLVRGLVWTRRGRYL